MCGIVGFTGVQQAAPILLDGLSKLEYRGYDSAGIAVRNGENETEVVKAKGRLKALAEKTDNGATVLGSCGIGHTRWATHGEPSESNAHPHKSDDGNVVAVHNGIIENYLELKEKLTRKGYVFYSETDTEVAVKLIDYYYKKYEGTPIDAINHPKGLVIVISQSGETADSLAALRESKEKGVRTMAIVNVVGSSIAREADSVFYTLAGPEIAVATTKAYSTQLMATYILALQFAKVRGEISDETYKNMIAELQTIPDKIAKILEDKERIQWFASKQANAHDVFFVGRGIDYAICMEGSLKMKEISYIHSEAYAAGELKHGTISLIEDDILVVGVLTQPALYEKTISNMVECRSRGAYLMGLTTFGQYNIEDSTDFAVYIPKIDPHFATSLAVIPLQLLGYYISVAKGLDVDKPRNLAKSVTVE